MKKLGRVSSDVKEQILNRIKNEGANIKQVAEEHGINFKTIYGWIGKGVAGQPSMLEYSRLKRENQTLKEMIGEITIELKRAQKNN